MLELIIRLIIEALQARKKRQQGEGQPLAVAARALAPTATKAQSAQSEAEERRAVAAVLARLVAIERTARAEAARCSEELANERFVATLEDFIAKGAETGRRALEGKAKALHVGQLANRLQSVLDLTLRMVEQRRDSRQRLLLGDCDALADACYQPLVEFARGQGIRLSSERAVTVIGGKELSGPEIWLGFNPTGLAPVLLPQAWASEIGWWPALAHEMGHDFHASVVGFDRELRSRLELPAPGRLPDGASGVSTTDLERAWSAWLPEVFADAFGTLMLGPAYLATMMWSFARPDKPMLTQVVAPLDGWAGFEEHPPGHLRVVLGCRLLAEIGFPSDADRLEKEWRKKHAEPDRFFLPTRDGTWISIAEDALIERGTEITQAIYEEGRQALSGVALRSIPGLDLGPREHQAALETRTALFAGRPAPTRDPRILIAGAVLAWRERPASVATILRAARATIRSVGATQRELRARAGDITAAASPDDARIGIDELREAIVLSAAIAPARRSLLRRPL